MEKEAVFEDFKFEKETTKNEVEINKDYEHTISALKVLATQRKTDLISVLVEKDGNELINYLNKTGKNCFAKFLGKFVKKDKEKAREM